MKKFLFTVLSALAISSATAQTDSIDLSPLRDDISVLQASNDRLQKNVADLVRKNKTNEARIKKLTSRSEELLAKIDSLQRESTNNYNKVVSSQKADKSELSTQLVQTNNKVQATDNVVLSRTKWGVYGLAIVIIALIVVAWTFIRKIKSGNSSIDDVRKAQSSLEEAQKNLSNAQAKMQEESVKLDSKLVEVLSKQPVSAPAVKDNGEVDHSLALKVADEIVRIETNLARMDPSIKGYKQLSKAVQRIRENFFANDYEIVDMLGKPYNPGMKAIASFVPDETLKEDEQIITRIIKPQVNYKNIMIQAAQIEVSQSV